MKVKKCDEVLELLSLYIDNELDEDRASMVREHIEACDDCKVEFEQLCEVVKMCNDIDEIELPENFKQDLHVKLSDEQQKIDDNRKSIVMRSRILRTISSIAAVLMIVLVARGVINTGKNSLVSDSSNIMLQESQTKENKASEIERNGAVNEDVVPQVGSGQLYGSSPELTEAFDKESLADNKEEYSVLPDQTKVPGAERTSEMFNRDEPRGLILETTAKDVPEETPDNRVVVEFNEAVDENLNISNFGYEIVKLQNNICLTLNSENIEADKSEMNKIAGQFGTVTEDYTDAFLIASEFTASSKSVDRGNNDNASVYKVSYIMDKSDYDKFIKEVNASFSGKVSVINDMEQLNTRLKAIENYIAVLEAKKSDITDQLKSLYEAKENITKRLEDINSSEKTKVTITISQNP